MNYEMTENIGLISIIWCKTLAGVRCILGGACRHQSPQWMILSSAALFPKSNNEVR